MPLVAHPLREKRVISADLHLHWDMIGKLVAHLHILNMPDMDNYMVHQLSTSLDARLTTNTRLSPQCLPQNLDSQVLFLFLSSTFAGIGRLRFCLIMLMSAITLILDGVL